MKQRIAHVALVVRDYDEAIAFYTRKLAVFEDLYGNRWDLTKRVAR